MSHPATIDSPGGAARLTLDHLQRAALWLLIASGWYVIVEPAPYELLFVLALLLYLPSGLAVLAATSPMVLFLILYNMGGLASLSQTLHDPLAINFALVSVYMAVTAMFFAFCVSADPLRRMAVIRNGWIVAGTIAAATGLIGYFDLGGMGERWAPIARAQGTFKDPNVLSTFLIAPALFLIQGFLLGTQRWRLASAAALLLMLAAIFLAFSRGAWINLVLACLLAGGTTFLVTPFPALRVRIVVATVLGALFAMGLLAALLSIEQVREIFIQRATLLQSYDAGETGRFGNQINSLPLILGNPLGLAPKQFRHIFGSDPHNVYLNAFAAYGWLGGVSYFLLVLSSFAAGWKAMFTRTPWQHLSIVIFSALFGTMVQGIQIDTDHWRHFYLLLGCGWGLYAATLAYTRTRPSDALRPAVRPS